MELLTVDGREKLEAQGFGIAELKGFDHHSLPLHAHHKIGDKRRGDVVLTVRIGNPESLDDGEATYLARKAFHGMFPWLPGKECRRRTFRDLQIDGNGRTIDRGAPMKGCKWCRRPRRSADSRSKGSQSDHDTE